MRAKALKHRVEKEVSGGGTCQEAMEEGLAVPLTGEAASYDGILEHREEVLLPERCHREGRTEMCLIYIVRGDE